MMCKGKLVFPVFASFLILTALASVSTAKTIYVPDDYEKIQWAVDNASAGDTIIVREGTYTENVDVNKDHLTIKSESGAEATIVQAANPDDHVFEVTADYVNISGFTVTGATEYTGWYEYKAGVYLVDVKHCNITYSNASDNYYGIFLDNSSYNNITNNKARNNRFGINLDDSSYNTLTYNEVSNNEYGIDSDDSWNNNISNNNLNSNKYFGIWLRYSSSNILANNIFTNDGLFVVGSRKNTVRNNIVNGKPLVYFEDASDHIIEKDAGQVILVYCDNIRVEGLNIHNTTVGIELWRTDNSNIVNNNVSNNYYGIYLKGSSNILTNNKASNNNHGIWLGAFSSDNALVNNTANSNNDYGICLEYSCTNNIISNNKASNNNYGILLESSSNNTLINNTANSNNWDGILLSYSSNNTLTNNTMSNNRYNFGIQAYNIGYIQNIDTSNKVNGKSIYYWVGQQNQQIPNDAGFVGIINSANITVKDLTLTNNGYGILIAHSKNLIIENISAFNNGIGIMVDYSDRNILRNNTLSNNSGEGIYLYKSSNNTIVNNIISGNERGIYLSSSTSDNLIYNNNFDNTNNARDDGNNIWNVTKTAGTNIVGGSWLGGNYWSDYEGEDLDGDGLGDTLLPYNSSGAIQNGGDWLPLVKPPVFDTGSPANPYPSISGTQYGTITPNKTIIATKLYTYPCPGTGGHTEYARIWNKTWEATATWGGYIGDWHNISFDKTVVLLAGETYNYTIRTGSYPQIHHTGALPTKNGWINCTKFIDANGKVYYDWIPAIRLE